MTISLYEVTKIPVERFLPKILEKVRQSGSRALVLAENEEKVKDLSHILWTYAQHSFLVHGTKEDGKAEHQPIWLTNESKNLNNASILVLMDGRKDVNISSYERCLDIFDGTHNEALLKAKARQDHYKQEGYDVTYWQQDSTGQWIKS